MHEQDITRRQPGHHLSQMERGRIAELYATGTTLAGNAPDSYVHRLYHRIPVTQPLDAFVCQLSTNDGRHDKAMGQVTGAQQRHGFDETTTLGAIETILAYVQQHWAVPIVFFTCVRKHDANYGKLVQ